MSSRQLIGCNLIWVVFLLCALHVSSNLSWGESQQGQAHADRGLQFAQAGELPSAETELRQAVELEPKNAQFLTALGTVLSMEKKLDESSDSFRKALQFAPRDLTTRRYLAANLWQLHRYPEAKRELQILLRQQPNDAPSRLLLGMVSENSGDYATAAKMLRSVPKEVSKQPESIAALARSYYHLHQQEMARKTLAQLQSPRMSAESRFLGSEIADQAGDYAEAMRLLDSVRSGADSAAIEYRRAVVQYHGQKFAECRSTLQRLISSGGESAPVDNLLAWCYQRQDQRKPAVESLKRAIELAPLEESNYLDLGNVLLAQSLPAAALVVAKRAAAQFPDSPAVFRFKGLAESKTSQFTDAIASYKHASELDPTNADSQLGMAEAQASAGVTREAASTFEAAITRFPRDSRFKVAYAELLLKQAESGNSELKGQVLRLLRDAVASDVSNAEALYQLGKLELDDGRLGEACQHLERAVKLSPKSSEAHFVLSRAYRRVNRNEEASQQIEIYKRLKEKEDKSRVEANDERN